jgi:hypothetical protein
LATALDFLVPECIARGHGGVHGENNAAEHLVDDEITVDEHLNSPAESRVVHRFLAGIEGHVEHAIVCIFVHFHALALQGLFLQTAPQTQRVQHVVHITIAQGEEGSVLRAVDGEQHTGRIRAFDQFKGLLATGIAVHLELAAIGQGQLVGTVIKLLDGGTFEEIVLIGRVLHKSACFELFVDITAKGGHAGGVPLVEGETGILESLIVGSPFITAFAALCTICRTFNGELMQEIVILGPGPSYDPIRATFNQWISEWMRELGMPVESELTGFNTILTPVFVEANFDIYILGWSLGDPTFPNYYYEYFHSDQDTATSGNFNTTGYNNAEYDALAEEFLSATDVLEARELVYQMQDILADDVPYITLYYTTKTDIARDNVQFPYSDVLGGLEDLDGLQSSTYVLAK